MRAAACNGSCGLPEALWRAHGWLNRSTPSSREIGSHDPPISSSQIPTYNVPPVLLFDRSPSDFTEPAPETSVAKDFEDRVGQSLRCVPHQDVLAITRSQAFATSRRGDDRPPHCPRVKNLDPRPAPYPNGDH